MVKHLFSDIDGTLLQKGLLDAITLSKLKKFIDDGNKFYLATGRIDSDVTYLLENYIHLPVDYRITQNGAVVSTQNNQIIVQDLINKDLVFELKEYLFSLNFDEVRLEVSSVRNRYITKERQDNYFAEFNDISVLNPNLYNDLGVSVLPTVFLLISSNYEYLKQIQNYVNSNFINASAVITSSKCLEILNRGTSKGFAIMDIIKKHNIDVDDVYVVGDNENDISMFDNFKNSYVMQTAKEHVKARANYMVEFVGDVVDNLI